MKLIDRNKKGSQIDISIVTVSFNCKEYLQKCLESVKQEIKNSGLNVEMIVVESESKDGTKDLIKLKKYHWIKWIEVENKGFGAGNNVGMRVTKGKYILLLNPDAELKKDTLGKMFEYMQMHDDVGVLGPKIVYGDGSLQISAYDNYPGLMSAFLENTLLDRVAYWLWPDKIYPGKLFSRALHNKKEREVAHLLGAALMIRKIVYEVVGEFDEQFFMFREETDLQYRIKKADWKIVYYPKTVVVHHEGKSTGEARFKKENWMRKLNLYLPSVYKYQRKWGFNGSEWVLWLIYVLGSMWTILILTMILIINNIFGWIKYDFKIKVNKSCFDIMVYHWVILYWHIRRVFL